MKIATITTHSAHNYGAALQAYALATFVKSLGYECKIIDYRPKSTERAYRVLKRPSTAQGYIELLYRLVHYGSLNRRYLAFEQFQAGKMPCTERVDNVDDLTSVANSFDCVICGSDQIWNPDLHDFDEAYFLSFPGIEVNKISYAASFGLDVIPEKYKTEMKRRLSGFTSFGCRERSAQKIVYELTGKDSAFVLDPVFLLSNSEWTDLASERKLETSPYSLIYFLSNQASVGTYVTNKSDERGLKTVSIGFSPRDFGKPFEKIYDCGPCDFISAIKDAEFVVTNSFHGTCFSIIFHKNFYTRIQTGSATRNDRVVSLLDSLGLSDRLFTNEGVEKIDFDKETDWDSVDSRLAALVGNSKNYLTECLKCDDGDVTHDA